jgi:hypothetical protein
MRDLAVLALSRDQARSGCTVVPIWFVGYLVALGSAKQKDCCPVWFRESENAFGADITGAFYL